MIEIGTLVKTDSDWGADGIGIVTGYWIHPESEEEHVLVEWLTGIYASETDACLPETLEIIA